MTSRNPTRSGGCRVDMNWIGLCLKEWWSPFPADLCRQSFPRLWRSVHDRQPPRSGATESCRSKLPAVATAYRDVSRFRCCSHPLRSVKKELRAIAEHASIFDQSASRRILLTTQSSLSFRSHVQYVPPAYSVYKLSSRKNRGLLNSNIIPLIICNVCELYSQQPSNTTDKLHSDVQN